MGVVASLVREHIKNGEKIACVVPADALIAAGVSNWGGYGLIAAVESMLRYEHAETLRARKVGGGGHVVSAATSRDVAIQSIPGLFPAGGATKKGTKEGAPRHLAKLSPGCLLPTAEEGVAVRDAMIASGARDGISGTLDGSVDGMPFERHVAVDEMLRSLLLTSFGTVAGETETNSLSAATAESGK